MKRLFTLFFFITTFFSTSFAQVTVDYKFTNITTSNDSVYFDIYVKQGSASTDVVYLNTSEFAIDYDPAEFTSPVINKVKEAPSDPFENGFNDFASTTYSDPAAFVTNATIQKGYYDNIDVGPFGANTFVIAINLIGATSESDFDDRIAVVDGTPDTHRVGRYSISGYTGTNQGNLLWNETFSNAETTDRATQNTNPITIATFDPVAIVPVELTSFTATAKNTDAVITWESAVEEGLSHYEVQRSNNAKDWITINETSANGNNSSYSYLDENIYQKGAGKTTFYYRLKNVDHNGSLSFSDIEAVDFSGKQDLAEFTITPNPAFSEFAININDGSNLENTRYRILNINGQIALEGILTSNKTIVNIDLPSGMYLVQVINEESSVFNAKKLMVYKR